jgi:hypothetical protein
LKDVKRAKREEGRLRPRNKKQRARLASRKGKKLGLEEGDLEVAENDKD